MVDGVTARRVVYKTGSIADGKTLLRGQDGPGWRLVGHFLYIETRPLGPQVVEFGEQSSRQFRLKTNIPRLRIQGAVIAIHGEGVENGFARRGDGEPSGKR